MNDTSFEARISALLDRLRRAAERAKAMDPLSEAEYSLVEIEESPTYGDRGRPSCVVRVVHGSGHGGESAHVVQREAAIWAAGGRPTAVILDDLVNPPEELELDPSAEDAPDLLEAVERFMKEVVGMSEA